jgi:hypothetical protein
MIIGRSVSLYIYEERALMYWGLRIDRRTSYDGKRGFSIDIRQRGSDGAGYLDVDLFELRIIKRILKSILLQIRDLSQKFTAILALPYPHTSF